MTQTISGKFGRYEILTEIARGGMATVYHAHDPRFERDVAIKVLPQALLHDPQFRTRFEREAKVIARLEHPAIVPVYDFGEEDGQPYIIMRFMSGGDLSEMIARGPMSLDETAKIISRLAPALDAAHALDIIHRDIKPGNVLFDRYSNAYLSDFGIARIISEDQAATITGGAIIGTPAYMSPEQVQGMKTISGRTDIYALGILIYQMLTGERPYQADSTAQLMMMHILEPVPKILEKRPDLAPILDDVIAKAIAKEPEARFASVSELSEALESIARGEPYQISSPASDLLVSPDNPELVKAQAVTILSPQDTDTLPSDAPIPSPATSPTRGEPRSRTRRNLYIVFVIALLVLIFGTIAFFGLTGNGGWALLSPATETPTSTIEPSATNTPFQATDTLVNPTDTAPAPTLPILVPTDTEEAVPEATETPTATPEPLVIGGADKIAFLEDSEIWAANLDGSELQQLTVDGTVKKGLQWSPDGKSIQYIIGKCVNSVSIEDNVISQIACFNNAGELKSFQTSPDGNKVAISLDNQLYIVPYELEQLSAATKHSDLRQMAECEHFAHYKPFFVKLAQWSNDANLLGTIIMATTGDLIQIIAVDQCVEFPKRLYSIPRAPYPEDFKVNPGIRNFGWDGDSLFIFNSLNRRNGFGNLYRYNMGLIEEGKIFSEILNPINGKCCYRNSSYSPDGKYLLFAYQENTGDGIQFYLIQDGLIGTGVQYEPLALPEIIASGESSYPILRASEGQR